MILEVLCLSASVTLDHTTSNILLSMFISSSSRAQYQISCSFTVKLVHAEFSYGPSEVIKRTLPILHYFSHAYNPDDNHTFILLAEFVLRTIYECLNHKGVVDVTPLFACMQEVAQRCHDAGRMNCGGFTDLPWPGRFKTILVNIRDKYMPKRFRDSVPDVGEFLEQSIIVSGGAKRRIVQLLSTLERSYEAGFLTGETIAEDLATCFLILDTCGSLLDGWQWRVDADDNVYYRHTVTHETTSIRPGCELPTSLELADGSSLDPLGVGSSTNGNDGTQPPSSPGIDRDGPAGHDNFGPAEEMASEELAVTSLQDEGEHSGGGDAEGTTGHEGLENPHIGEGDVENDSPPSAQGQMTEINRPPPVAMQNKQMVQR